MNFWNIQQMLHLKFRNKHLYLKIPMLNYDILFICKQLVYMFLAQFSPSMDLCLSWKENSFRLNHNAKMLSNYYHHFYNSMLDSWFWTHTHAHMYAHICPHVHTHTHTQIFFYVNNNLYKNKIFIHISSKNC